jgi:hypothetical protein
MYRLSPALLVAFVSLFFAAVLPTSAADTAKPKKIPFHGKLQAVDTSADTITIAGKTPRVFQLTSTTKITDGAGNPSTLAAATVGEDVGGSYEKDASGTKTLFSVRFGAKTGTAKAAASTAAPAAETPAPAAATPPPAQTPAPAATEPAATTAAPAAAPAASPGKKSRFSGKIVSVDATANTLVIHGETLTFTASSKLTDSTGAAITLADLAAGDKITGSGTKAADGTVTVASLKKAK